MKRTTFFLFLMAMVMFCGCAHQPPQPQSQMESKRGGGKSPTRVCDMDLNGYGHGPTVHLVEKGIHWEEEGTGTVWLLFEGGMSVGGQSYTLKKTGEDTYLAYSANARAVFQFDQCWMRAWFVDTLENEADLGCPHDGPVRHTPQDHIVEQALRHVVGQVPPPASEEVNWWVKRKSAPLTTYESIHVVYSENGKSSVEYGFHRESAATAFSHERTLLAEDCPEWVGEGIGGCIAEGGDSPDDPFCESKTHAFVEAYRDHLKLCKKVYSLPYYDPGDESMAMLPVE